MPMFEEDLDPSLAGATLPSAGQNPYKFSVQLPYITKGLSKLSSIGANTGSRLGALANPDINSSKQDVLGGIGSMISQMSGSPSLNAAMQGAQSGMAMGGPLGAGLGGGAGLLGGVLGGRKGAGIASGAASGAASGIPLGPWGMAAGGLLGALQGGKSGNKPQIPVQPINVAGGMDDVGL